MQSRNDLKETLNKALIASLLEDYETVLQCYELLKESEAKGEETQYAKLSDNVFALLLAREQDREARSSICRKLLSVADDDYSKAVAYGNRNSDELLQARQLLRENLYNHFVGMFNYVSGNVSRVINGNMQAVLQIFIDAAFSFRRLGRLSPRQSESLVLLKRFLDKHPLSSEDDWAEEKTLKLEHKLEKRHLEENLLVAEKALQLGCPQTALFYLDNALKVFPDCEQAKRLRLKAIGTISREERMVVASASVWEKPVFFKDDNLRARYERSLRKVILDDAESEGSFGIIAEGNRRDEKKIFTQPRPLNPGRYLIDKYHEACAEVRKEKTRFLLLGQRGADERLYIISSGIVQASYDALENLGVFFLFDVALRGIRLAGGSPVSEESAIDTGAKYVRRFPDTVFAQRTCRDIADRYQRAGEYEQALKYHLQGGSASPKKIRGLKEKAARGLFSQIMQVADDGRRLKYLNLLLQDYPGTRAAKAAKREIARLEESLETEYSFTKEDLLNTPRLLAEDALDISPELVDGSKENGEVDSEGVRVLRDDIAVYREVGERRQREIRLSPQGKKKLDWVQSEQQYLRSSRSKMLRLKQRKFVPLEISGSIGGQGVLVYPTLKPIERDSEGEE